jgi:hypothetical protein
MLRLSVVAVALLGGCQAFSPALPFGSLKLRTSQPSACSLEMAVQDVSSAAQMDEIIKSSGMIAHQCFKLWHGSTLPTALCGSQLLSENLS